MRKIPWKLLRNHEEIWVFGKKYSDEVLSCFFQSVYHFEEHETWRCILRSEQNNTLRESSFGNMIFKLPIPLEWDNFNFIG